MEEIIQVLLLTAGVALAALVIAFTVKDVTRIFRAGKVYVPAWLHKTFYRDREPISFYFFAILNPVLVPIFLVALALAAIATCWLVIQSIMGAVS